MRLAAIQLRVKPNQRSENLRAALRALESAAAHDPHPELILLPNLADFLCIDPAKPEPLAGPTLSAFTAAARELGLFIALGMCARLDRYSGPLAILIDYDGDILAAQPPLTDESSPLITRKTPLGPTALLIADDAFDPRPWHTAGQSVASLILIPASTAPSQRTARDDLASLAKPAAAWILIADTSIDAGKKSTPGATSILTPDARLADHSPPNITHACHADTAAPARQRSRDNPRPPLH